MIRIALAAGWLELEEMIPEAQPAGDGPGSLPETFGEERTILDGQPPVQENSCFQQGWVTETKSAL